MLNETLKKRHFELVFHFGIMLISAKYANFLCEMDLEKLIEFMRRFLRILKSRKFLLAKNLMEIFTSFSNVIFYFQIFII